MTPTGRPVSSVLSFYFRDEVLPYYAGDVPEARELAANDFKYWELMRRACERGCEVFDYGRSKRGAGSFAFKKTGASSRSRCTTNTSFSRAKAFRKTIRRIQNTEPLSVYGAVCRAQWSTRSGRLSSAISASAERWNRSALGPPHSLSAEQGRQDRSYHLLRYLAARYHVHLGTFIDSAADAGHVRKLDQWCASHRVMRLRPRWARLRSMVALLTGEPLTLRYYRNAQLRRWVESTIREKLFAKP